jgi:hypothetical protein
VPLPDENAYDILGLLPGAGPAEIKAAHLRAIRARTHSPRDVNAAAATLRNPDQRLLLDLRTPAPARWPAALAETFADAAPATFLPPLQELGLPPLAALVVIRPDEVARDWRPPAGEPAPFEPVEQYAVTAAVLPPVEVPE